MSKINGSKTNGTFKVKFRGIRGSYPTPHVDMLKYGGNTSCVEINVNGHLIIIDAGTGLIGLGNDMAKAYISSGTNDENREAVKALILISHIHHDHIHGFPFFKPAYIPTSKIYMYGAKSQGISFGETLAQSMFSSTFPVDLGEMAAQLLINNFKESDVILLRPGVFEPEIARINSFDESAIDENTVVISCLKCYAHPKDGVLLFKIKWQGKSVVYATDKESYLGGDSRLASFARNTDILIHDAQYTFDDYIEPIVSKQGYGHSTPEMAIEAARQSNAKKLVLFHLDPSYDDKMAQKIEDATKKQFPNSLIAYEGLELEL